MSDRSPSVSAAPAAPARSVLFRLRHAGGLTRKTVEVAARQVQERCGARVVARGPADLTVELAVQPGGPAEGFTIANGAAGSVRIAAPDERGLLYGVGKLLRDSRYTRDGFTPGAWRGSSAPAKPVRGIYFATHFHNFYHDAPVAEVRRYVEDLALWGVNTLVVWYDMHHFQGWDDPAAVAFRKRLHSVMACARDVGMTVGLGMVVNEGYGNSPAALHADTSGMRGAAFATDICTSKPEGQKYVLDNFARLFAWARDLQPGFVWIWPYDSGGCGCTQCRPWGSNGFLRAAERLARLVRQMLPGARIALSTWFLDEAEWQGLAKAFATRPDWADALVSQADTYAFTHSSPGGLPIVGFPEISMDGMWPWGGFGANPRPGALQSYWRAVKAGSEGGFPYSEGIYEDVNKVLCAQLYWSPDRPVDDIVREYAAFEFGPDVADEVVAIVRTLERNHHWRWWPGLLDGYQGWFPSKGAAPQQDPEAEGAYEAAKRVSARLGPFARKSWRWRILYLRALLDAELKANGGRPNPACEEAFEELTRIYHAAGAQVDLKPPAARSMADPLHHRRPT